MIYVSLSLVLTSSPPTRDYAIIIVTSPAAFTKNTLPLNHKTKVQKSYTVYLPTLKKNTRRPSSPTLALNVKPKILNPDEYLDNLNTLNTLTNLTALKIATDDTFELFPLKAKFRKYGRIAIKSIMFNGVLTNLHLFGENVNLVKYSNVNQPMQKVSIIKNVS